MSSRVRTIYDQYYELVGSGWILNRTQEIRLAKAILFLNDDRPEHESPSTRRRKRRVHMFWSGIAMENGLGAAFLCIITVSISPMDENRSIIARSFTPWWDLLQETQRLNELAMTRLVSKLSNMGRARLGLNNILSATTTHDQSRISLRLGDKETCDPPVSDTDSSPAAANIDTITEGGWGTSVEMMDKSGEHNNDQDSADAAPHRNMTMNRSRPYSDSQTINETLSGNVYRLSPMDLVKAACFGNGDADILLTIPVHRTMKPFITITCSRAMSMQLRSEGPRLL